MDKNPDSGDSAFEDRIRTLFENGSLWRGVSATSVIQGARHRRVRHRATAAGASFAVLGVAAGAAAFGGHAVGSSRTTGVQGTVTVATSTTTSTPAPSATSTSAAETCSAPVSGTVPALTRSTADGLDFETVSGATAGIPWSVQIHAFADWQSWFDWRKTQTDPPDPASESSRVGPPALFRSPGTAQFTESAVPAHFFGLAGRTIGRGDANSPKVYLTVGWVASGIDHLCLQFAHHAEFEPVYVVQGRGFMVFGYSAADEPQRLVGYNTTGEVVATMDGKAGLVPPKGM